MFPVQLGLEAARSADRRRRVGVVEGGESAGTTSSSRRDVRTRCFVTSFCARLKHFILLKMTISVPTKYRAIRKTYVTEMRIELNVEWDELNRLIWVS